MAREVEKADCVLKLIVLGAPGAGKTCIIRRYCTGHFDENTNATMWIDSSSTLMTRKNAVVEFKIWDTVGQDTYSSLTRMYYNGTHGVLLVYDITDLSSFTKVKYWLGDLKKNGSGLEKMVIVGNKVDVVENRKVPALEASIYASELKIKWLECSAKTGQGVIEAFRELMEEVFDEYESNEEFTKIGRNSTIVVGGNRGFDLNGRTIIIENKKSNKLKRCCCL
eukprot:TRINITY_DN1010_c0_g2_i2.p1 TRINITY_DN1010_c0_g2~~TRINITY_DN1010_c0_g2_i2.p1  ORF type:complete len:223 (-),score=56.93 TRINITY_DN1010_c0_g2_i2:63-731(-)